MQTGVWCFIIRLIVWYPVIYFSELDYSLFILCNHSPIQLINADTFEHLFTYLELMCGQFWDVLISDLFKATGFIIVIWNSDVIPSFKIWHWNHRSTLYICYICFGQCQIYEPFRCHVHVNNVNNWKIFNFINFNFIIITFILYSAGNFMFPPHYSAFFPRNFLLTFSHILA